MSNLVLPSGVDQTTLSQKIVAGGLLALGGVALWWLLPPVIVILANLWMAIALALPLLWVAYNPTLVWGIAKTVSWKVTKSIIGLDVLSAMDRYYDWVCARLEVTVQSRQELSATLERTKKDIKEKEKSYRQSLERADQADRLGNKVEASIAASRAVADKEFLESLIPIRDEVQLKVDYLDELIGVFKVNKEQLRYAIDSKKTQFEALKSISKGLASANAVIGGSNEATKLYEESLNQLADKMSRFAANIQTFETNIKPVLEGARFDKQMAEVQGRKLLEEFRASNFQE